MKKKILLALPLIGSFLLSGCKINLGGKTIYLFEEKPSGKVTHVTDPTTINDVPTDDMTQHATAMNYGSNVPTAPFYLKVGERRNLSVSLSPAPALDSEKTCSWEKDNDNISFTVNSEDSKKVVVEGLTPGTTKLTATNDYNTNLSKEFVIKVIDFDEENDYLWQYSSEDRKQFGYDSTEEKLGTLKGEAVLNGVTWSYTRSSLESLQSSGGAIGFGKGANPETHIHLETENNRLVKEFVIEAASANSLARMTIKVNDTVYFDNQVPKESYNVIQTLHSNQVLPTDGKIQIDVVTPEYDPNQTIDPNYKKPGAFFLKSILIHYEEERFIDLAFDDNSKHKVDYVTGEVFTTEGMLLNKVSDRGVLIPVNIEKEEEAKKLTYTAVSFDTASHDAHEVEIRLVVDGYEEPFTLTYSIHVRSAAWLPESINISGEVEHQNLIEGDEVDYSDLRITVVYSAAHEDYMYAPFEESDVMSFSYGSDGDPFVAEKEMENGYTIVVTGHFVPEEGQYTKTVSGSYPVSAGILTIAEAIYDRIDFRRASTINRIIDAGLKTDGAPLSYLEGSNGEHNRVRLDFDKVAKGYRLSDHKALPKTLSNFYLTVLDKNLSIDKLNIEFANVSNKTNNYRLFSSIYGGDIYGGELSKATNHKIVFNDFDSHVNNLKFEPGLTSTGSYVNANTGIVSILIRYTESPHVNYELSYGETAPYKLEYLEGEEFNPEGLVVNMTSDSLEEPLDVTQYIKWYDGSTYNEAKQKTLTPASTHVVGEFHEFSFTVNITSVKAQSVHVTRVTSVDEITADGKYYITCPTVKAVLLGSAKNSEIFTGKGISQQENVSFGDEIDFNILLKEDYISILPQEDGTFVFETRSGANFGLTAKGGGDNSVASGRPYTHFTVEIDETGIVSASVTATELEKPVTFYLGCNTSGPTIKLYSQDKANIVIYKVS